MAGSSAGTTSGITRRPSKPRGCGSERRRPWPALDQARDAVRVHVKLIARAQFAEGFRIGLGDAAQVDQLGEEALETSRRDDFENPARLIPGVPEGVPFAARLEDQVAGTGLQNLIELGLIPADLAGLR